MASPSAILPGTPIVGSEMESVPTSPPLQTLATRSSGSASSSSASSSSLSYDPGEDPFFARLFAFEEQYLRLTFEAEDLKRLLLAHDAVKSNGKPAEMDEQTWLQDRQEAEDELKYIIDKLKDNFNRVNGFVLELHLDYTVNEGLSFEAGDPTEQDINTFEQRFRELEFNMGDLCLEIDWSHRRMWTKLFDRTDGMWGDQFVPQTEPIFPTGQFIQATVEDAGDYSSVDSL